MSTKEMCLYGCYVHSSIVPTFHRRCYWLLQNPDMVLVHYLNVPSLEDSGKNGPLLCAVSDRHDSLRWSRADLVNQLKPMFHSIKWTVGSQVGASVDLSVEQLVQHILDRQQTKPQPRTHSCLCETHTLCNLYQVKNYNFHTIATHSSPPPPRLSTATVAISNRFYGEQHNGVTTVALPQNAVIVMATTTTAATVAATQPSPTPSSSLSLTLLPSPVIGGLLLTPSPTPSPAPPPPPFDPDAFLNFPKQGQTYGGPGPPTQLHVANRTQLARDLCSSTLATKEKGRDLDHEDTPMDTHSATEEEELELSFDSQFPDLISELITVSAPPPGTSPAPGPALPGVFPSGVRYMGGVKVLITGPWADPSGRYSCVFDQSSVPASLVQPGVLRCYCPAHEAGLVCLQVVESGGTASSSVLFEFRARNTTSLPSSQLDWLSLDDNQFRMSILERLEHMERRMAQMASRDQQHQQHHQHHQHQQQLSAQEQSQGYTHLIHTLISWRSVHRASLDLEDEASAEVLYRWDSSALGRPDSLGRLPLAVARSRGHTRLASSLEDLHTRLPLSPPSSSPDTGLSSASSLPSPADPASPSPSSAYSSAPTPMDTSSPSLSPLSPPSPPPSQSPSPPSPPSPPLSQPLSFLLPPSQMWVNTAQQSQCLNPSVMMDYESSLSPPPLEDSLLTDSENQEEEDDLQQVDMALLAEQIVEATPERIKREDFPRGAELPLSSPPDPWLATYLQTVDTPPASALALQRLRPPSSAAWAEFLNASTNGRMERDFALLTLSDSEQRELYEAARIIQTAFRRYKGRRLKEQQDMAAAYALYKKMTQAAILIQSKFRSYYEQKRFQQSRRAAVLIQQYYRSYREYGRLKQGPHNPRLKGSFLTKKQDQAARKIMRFLRRCRNRSSRCSGMDPQGRGGRNAAAREADAAPGQLMAPRCGGAEASLALALLLLGSLSVCGAED
ncbi:hypothetical protein NHX12_014206, partial [Muraenolepis orangiensis]